LVSRPQGRNEIEDIPQQYIMVTLVFKMAEIANTRRICTAQSREVYSEGLGMQGLVM
jgi:hypothetical protein